MKTVVYQSFRTHDVPRWISTCLDSVRHWAGSLGFDYRFVGDEMLRVVPRWYWEKVRGEIHLVSDLARLLLAQGYLASGYERTVWVDADVLVFDPGRFVVEVERDYAFCKEIWLERRGDKLLASRRVNNAVCVFVAGNPFLEFYVHACLEIARNRPGPFAHTEVGSGFLTALQRFLNRRLIADVGLFSPILMGDIAAGRNAVVPHYMRAFGSTVHAANLCATFQGRTYDGVVMTDAIFESVIDRLLATQGECINRYLG